MARTLVIIGFIIVATGLLWPVFAKIGFGRLPGDILIKRDNFSFYLPVTTMIIVSVVLSVILSVIFRLFR